jgi:hypothetical protein
MNRDTKSSRYDTRRSDLKVPEIRLKFVRMLEPVALFVQYMKCFRISKMREMNNVSYFLCSLGSASHGNKIPVEADVHFVGFVISLMKRMCIMTQSQFTLIKCKYLWQDL